ncbi:GNAT family N-acetyltransferase [Solwaraspora sp. WMMD406]|uniref:GNAT family N-acetyltransferase n=1 Tax=Solwaraspora sp. WMMD406 TaxID=3016095 RepID=UPI0024161220|nr:GNAT family N-acetyltransferase [Solwaraspora sp. WMMD406]MDG4763941.1 GNAT family N-acetyltransferase [Solwaraspora sp. WMMD406]
MEPVEITEGGVRLRMFLPDDAPAVADGCNDPLTRRFVPGMPQPYTEIHAMHWITEGSTSAWAGGGAAWAIADPATDELLGCVGLSRPVPERGQIEVGYWVVPRARGRGAATAATIAATRYALGNGFERVELLTDGANAASQRVALAAGFRAEGVRRGAASRPAGTAAQPTPAGQPVDGARPEPTRPPERDDLLVWARLAGDPPGPTPRTLPDLPGGRLTDGTVALRPLDADDTDFAYRLQTLPDVVATSVPAVVPTRDSIASRCALSPGKWLLGDRADLVIADAATGTATGRLGLYYQEPELGQAMIGYSMLPEWRRRGYPVRAIRLLARWVFAATGIERLIAGTLPDNLGSQRVLEKAGFRREGLMRARLPGPDGIRLDDLQYALLPADLPADLPVG